MNTPTKQICFDNSRRFTKGGALMMVLGLAIALTACGNPPTAEQPSVEGSTAAEATAPKVIESPATQSNPSSKIFAKDGVAIGGADPVAYFTEATYVPGNAEYAYEWQGATWQFASAENRDIFAENPEQYAPEYGGFCAWAVAAKNTLVPIDPEAWSVVDGKLYLNANQKVQTNWLKDVPGFIFEADSNWPTLSQS